MPIYEFECPVHGIFEVIADLKFCDIKYAKCTINETCAEICIKVWSIPGNIQIGSPTKVFVNNKTGEIYTPFSRYDKPPSGYHEQELRNPIERSKFEREQQRRVDAENQLTSHVLDSMKSQARKNRHDNLKARQNAVQRETYTDHEGKEQKVEFTLDHKDKELLNKAMERSKKKPRKEKKSDVMLAINHYNPSNMDQIK